MGQLRKSILWRIIAECVATLLMLIIALNFFKIFGSPTKSGFFCNDESLKYPYYKDTINSPTLYTFSLFLPIAVMALCEILQIVIFKNKDTADNHLQGRILFKLYQNILPFLWGFAIQGFFVHTAKLTVGRLRPYFFAVCQPYRSLDGSTCDNKKNHGIYIEDYECNNNNRVKQIGEHILNSIHLSFPSGHASLIFFGMIFLILYLQRFARSLVKYRIYVGLLMKLLQALCALLAWFVAISRVRDYKHHWSDVLVGIMLGTSVAIAVSLYVHQQLQSVNNFLEGSIKTLNSDTTSTTTFATTTTNNILVP